MSLCPPLFAQQAASPLSMLFPILAIAVFFYLLIWRPEKRRQNEHKSLLDALKTNDRVVTIGGIYGVVTNVRREDDRVTLRIDETTNTKIDVTVSAINRVITDGAADKQAK